MGTRRTLQVLFFLLLSIFSGCAQGEKPDIAAGDGRITIRASGIPVRVEVANTDQERQQGLMFRETLGEDEGMLFVFEQEQFLSFWMKNTYLPLSIAFISRDGEITAIEDMEPLDAHTVHRAPRPVLYALEMNQGWFTRHGIAVADRVEF
ncbi:MAG: DUF192 domain-containing protein [Candidatus Latescibacterota bacterium]